MQLSRILSVMNIKLIIILALLTPPVLAETIYKSVDAHGNVVFTDKPLADAEKIEIKKAQTISIPERKTIGSNFNKADKPLSYRVLEIVNLQNDQTIIGTQGNFSVAVKLEPALAEQHELVLFMDGKESHSTKGSSFTLNNVDRGTHSLQVAVRNQKNKISKRSELVNVHIRRTAQLAPQFAPDTNVESPLNPPRSQQASSLSGSARPAQLP